MPLRFYLEAGLFETEVPMADGYVTNILAANRNMREVLHNRGYSVRYAEFSGGHNPMNWPHTLPRGLLALLAEDNNPS